MHSHKRLFSVLTSYRLVFVMKIEVGTAGEISRHKAYHFVLVQVYRAVFLTRIRVCVEIYAHFAVGGRKLFFAFFLFCIHFAFLSQFKKVTHSVASISAPDTYSGTLPRILNTETPSFSLVTTINLPSGEMSKSRGEPPCVDTLSSTFGVSPVISTADIR